jgi:hypothetical protein
MRWSLIARRDVTAADSRMGALIVSVKASKSFFFEKKKQKTV